MTMNLEKFIQRAIAVHNHKYDYSKSDLNIVKNSSKQKIKIICKTHGPFWQTPMAHVCGQGCPMCGKESQRTDLSKFIRKSELKHDHKYNYSKSIYIDMFTPIIIICPDHGEFLQSPKHHLYGRMCPKCAKQATAKHITSKARDKFINDAHQVHNNQYDYSKVDYIHSKQAIEIICPQHGMFSQTPNAHLRGQGCPKCGIIDNAKSHHVGVDEFIARSRVVHENKYDYSKCKFVKLHDRVTIVCPKHGDFLQLAYNHLFGHGCPSCPVTISKPHQELIDFINLYNNNIIVNDRNKIKPFEIDVLIDDKLGIEFHGLYYHSYNKKESTGETYRHKAKRDAAVENNINLIQIFEDEWVHKKDLVKSMILSRLGINNKIGARMCEVKQISHKQCEQFCDYNHIYGNKAAKYKYGLFYDKELVFVMSFNKNGDHYEIERLCTKRGTIVNGGASKVLKRFISDVKPQKIITYCDLRFGNGGVYKKLGMRLIKTTKPNYFYVKQKMRMSRIKFQKHKLLKLLSNFDPLKTEAENMFANGYRRIWDAGHLKFEWHNQK